LDTKKLLNIDEGYIYKLNRIDNKSINEIVTEDKSQIYSYKVVKDILRRIDRKAYVFSRYDALYELISTYSLAFEVGKIYYEEKAAGIDHEFNIDYSDIHEYLYPHDALGNRNTIVSKNDFGSINYMLNPQHKKKYFMTPPTVCELIKKLHLLHEQVIRWSELDITNSQNKLQKLSPKISEFCNVIDNWDGKNIEVISRRLMSSYVDMGNFLEILTLVSENKLKARLAYDYSTVKNMLSGVVPALPEDLAEDIGQIETKDKEKRSIYDKALSRLNDCRPYYIGENNEIFYRDKNNEIDAANFAITYYLTERYNETKFYRFVSHSRHHTKAFRHIRYNYKNTDKHTNAVGKTVSCCPQCVSTLISIKNNPIDGIDDNDYQKKSQYMDRNKKILDNIKNQYNLAQYRGLYNIQDIKNKNKFMDDTLKPFYSYLVDFTKFTKQVYPSFIEQIMRINSGEQEGYREYFKNDLKFTRQIFADQKWYRKLMKEASDLVYADLKNTFNELCKYVDGKNEKLLTENMRKELKDIEKKLSS